MKRKIWSAIAFLLLCGILLCSFCACANAQNKKPIGTVGEYEIPYEQLRFVTMTYKVELDALYGDGNDENGTIWDDAATAEEHRAELEELVWETIKENYSVLQACDAYGIKKNVFDSSEVDTAVDQKIAELIAAYASKKEYKEVLKANYTTENLFRFYFALDEMKYYLYTAMLERNAFIADEAEFAAWMTDGNSAYVQHFLLRYDSEEEKEADRMVLEDARQKLMSGEWTLADCINRANDDLSNFAPYFAIRGVHRDALVDAAVALEDVGDVSEIVEIENALYVLVKMEETERENADGTIETPLSLQLSSLLSDYQWAIVGDAVAAAKENVVIELNDYGKEIDLVAMK